jgi:selenocysteine-specific elongation factor
MIIATAGHVDHGKTSLVRWLTGIDTDRLPEEKRRGMTIEPGFAHLRAGEGEPIGFVDVPGHERFVRHMMAGVASVDVALLVVAADDGPMPQTREHLAILELLGLTEGVVALTKVDREPAARVAEVEAAIRAVLADTPFAQAPVFPVSVVSGEGLAALQAHLTGLRDRLPARAQAGLFRMPVDRSFTRTGAGLVVAGAPTSGQVRVGDELRASPGGPVFRVRGLQVHGQEVEVAVAGQRCALNLAGAERDDVARGDWLLAPALHAPTQRLDVRLRMLPGAPRPLDADAPLHLHLGATQRAVRAVPLVPRTLDPGASGFVQLVLHEPVSALHGDRFVLRDPAAQLVVGGGTVLDPFAPARGRSKPERIADLEALSASTPEQALASLLEHHPGGLPWAPFALAWNLEADTGERVRAAVPRHELPARDGLWLVGPAAWQALQQTIVERLDAWHAEHPDSLGLAQATLLAGLASGIDARVRQAALQACIDAGTVIREGFVLRRPAHRAQLAAADQTLLATLRAAMEPMGLRPPPLGELAPLLGMDLPAATAFLQRAATLGHLVMVAKNRYFLPETILDLVRVARETAAAAPDGKFDAATFRDRSGIGRNLTIQLLEFFDRSGITRYAAERRVMAAGYR